MIMIMIMFQNLICHDAENFDSRAAAIEELAEESTTEIQVYKNFFLHR